MSNEYLAAPRSAMLIRLVEPAEFRSRIVTERRPLSLHGDVVLQEGDTGTASVSAGTVLAILLIVVAFSFVVAYGLESFINTV